MTLSRRDFCRALRRAAKAYLGTSTSAWKYVGTSRAEMDYLVGECSEEQWAEVEAFFKQDLQTIQDALAPKQKTS